MQIIPWYIIFINKCNDYTIKIQKGEFMKREPDYKLKKRMERIEHEKKMNRTYSRNWIICIGSLAIIILAVFVFGGK